MSDGRELLLDIIRQNNGTREFPKSTNRRLLEILAELAISGEVEVTEDTPDSITYRLIDNPGGQ